MFEGVLVFLVLAAAGLAGEIFLVDRLRDSQANDWLADHVWLPALRMPALIGFVLASYPALYGLESGPPLSTLLDFDWFGQALNLLFILPLLFSLLPVAGRSSALVLPLQGVALTALLFLPLSDVLENYPRSYLPDGAALLAILLLAVGGHVVGTRIALKLPHRNLALPAYDGVILLCQAPAILAYGRALGERL